MDKLLHPTKLKPINEKLDDQKYFRSRLITDMEWYNVVTSNNDVLVNTILENSNAEEQLLLLNAPFDFRDSAGCPEKDVGFLMTTPLCIAVGHSAMQSVRVMLNHNVDVFQKDLYGFNVTHCIVAVAYGDKTREPEMREVYASLRQMLNRDDLQRLLKDENDDGLRPLEFAAQHGIFLVMREIFETETLYITKNVIHGPLQIKWYDITDYEYGGARYTKSPILFLSHIDETLISSDSVCQTIESPDCIFREWCEKKMKYYKPLVVLWFLLRLLFTTCLFLNHNHDWKNFSIIKGPDLAENCTSKYTLCKPYMYMPLTVELKITLTAYLIIHAVAIMLLDTFEFFYHGWKYKHLYSSTLCLSKATEARFRFYRIGQFVLAVSTVFSLYWSESTFIFNCGYIMLYTVCMWSILYFVQLMPSVGHFVIIIQHMFKDFFHFLLIFILLFLPFPQIFFRILNESSPCVEIPDIPLFYYNTIIIMLNMVNFSSMLEKVRDPTGLAVTHLLFVFVVAVLLINFLVALFSNSVSIVTSNKRVIVPIQCLSVVIPLEKRECIKYPLYPYFRLMQRQCYTVQNGRVYLVQKIISYKKIKPITINNLATTE